MFKPPKVSIVSDFLYFFSQTNQILTIRILLHRFCQKAQFVRINPTFAESDFLQTCHFQALPFLYHFNKCRCFRERIMRSRIKPRKSPAQYLHFQLTFFQECLVHAGYLQFAPCRRTDLLSSRNQHFPPRFHAGAGEKRVKSAAITRPNLPESTYSLSTRYSGQ